MWVRSLISFFLLLSFPQLSFCQFARESLKLGPVLADTIKISGNFGEIRGNHFHSGIDFKTNETEGKPIFAAAEGYVSRVKVSSAGYGRAIYITHADNLLTVYGHMRLFYPVLEDTVRKLQSGKQDYELEFFPDSGAFQVQMGDIIGFSGNTGSSEGPHVHFETRHADTEWPFNPEDMGYLIYDTIPPEITALAIYNPGPYGSLAHSSKQLLEKSRNRPLFRKDTIVTGSQFFVGFEAFDKIGTEENHLGIRSWSLFLDDSLVFTARIDSFSFDETRMVNATIDYPFYRETGRKMVLCYLMKGNKLSFLENKNGMVLLNDSLVHQLKVRVFDTSGNPSESGCFIRKNKSGKITACAPEGFPYKYGNEAKITTPNFRIDIAPLSFYEDLNLEYFEKPALPKNTMLHSPVISIGPAGTAIGDPLIISIKPEINSSYDSSKVIAVQIDRNGQLHGLKTTREKDRIVFKTRTMGDFGIAVDTLVPLMREPCWEPDNYSGKWKLILELYEDLSGIAISKCFINDTWIPCPYSPGKNLITIYPEDIPETAETFKVRLELKDGAGNEAKYEQSVTFIK